MGRDLQYVFSPWQCRGFIRGDEGDLPQLITFQKNCRHGALLATVSHMYHVGCGVICDGLSGYRHG